MFYKDGSAVIQKHQRSVADPKRELELWARNRATACLLTEHMMGVSSVMSPNGLVSSSQQQKRMEFQELRRELRTQPADQVLQRWPHHAPAIVTLRLGLSGHWPRIPYEGDSWLNGVKAAKVVTHDQIDQKDYEQMIEEGLAEEQAIGLVEAIKETEQDVTTPVPVPVRPVAKKDAAKPETKTRKRAGKPSTESAPEVRPTDETFHEPAEPSPVNIATDPGPIVFLGDVPKPPHPGMVFVPIGAWRRAGVQYRMRLNHLTWNELTQAVSGKGWRKNLLAVKELGKKNCEPKFIMFDVAKALKSEPQEIWPHVFGRWEQQ